MRILKVLGVIVYIGLSILQIAAIITGVTATLGIFGILLGLLLGPMPLIGTIMGIIGATKVWGWSIGLSLLLFGAPLLFSFIFGLRRNY